MTAKCTLLDCYLKYTWLEPNVKLPIFGKESGRSKPSGCNRHLHRVKNIHFLS